MSWFLIIAVALRALWRNKTRSLLTALGIIIGIAAVIAVVSVGEGATAMMKAQIDSMGVNLVTIWPGASRSGGFRSSAGSIQTLTAEDGDAVAAECDAVVAQSPMVRTGAQMVFRENNWPGGIHGVNAQYLDVRNWPLESGSFFTEADVRTGARVCVVGTTVVRELFGGEDPVGKTFRIKNMTFRVLGVLTSKGTTAWGSDQDDDVIMPWTTVRRNLDRSSFNNVHQLSISLRSMEHLESAKEEIRSILRQRHRIPPGMDEDFSVMDMAEMTAASTQIARVMTMLLTVIASISLLVGGIGIMNIMLVSVTERTREIGLRMAVGARGRDILLQFLVEAVVLAGVGGILGVALGVFAAQSVAEYAKWPVLISTTSIFLALSVAAGVGIAFGFFPAMRASRLNPIESLRYE